MQSKYVKAVINIVVYLVGVLLVCILTPKLLRFFMPIVIGWILAMIANPLVRFLEKRMKIVRKHGSLFVVVGVLALIVTGIYFASAWLIREGMGFAQHLPEAYAAVLQGFREIGENLSGIMEKLSPNIKETITAFFQNIDAYIGSFIGKIGMPTLNAAGDIAKNIPNMVLQTIFAVLSAYFFVADRENIVARVREIMPDSVLERFAWIKNLFSKAVGGYFRAQFKIMGIVAVILWIGFIVLKIDYAVLWALLIALLDFLPFFGTGTAIWPWAAFQLLTGNYYMATGLMIIYLITQLVRQVIQPKIVGDSIGADPLATLVFMFIGYRISSVFGMIVAVPVGIIFINLYKAGAFDKIIGDIKMLITDFNNYRNH